HRHQHAILALRHFTHFYRAVVIEHGGHDAAALGHGQELRAETDDAARRHDEFQTHTAFAIRHHVDEVGLAATQLFHHRALMGFFAVDNDLLERLLHFAVDDFLHDFRTRYAHLEAFAAHVFDQHRQMQFAAAGD